VSDESLRLDHFAACQREAQSMIAPQYVPGVLPDHESEILSAHSGTAPSSTFSVAGEAE
jgi:hypothetical protein